MAYYVASKFIPEPCGSLCKLHIDPWRLTLEPWMLLTDSWIHGDSLWKCGCCPRIHEVCQWSHGGSLWGHWRLAMEPWRLTLAPRRLFMVPLRLRARLQGFIWSLLSGPKMRLYGINACLMCTYKEKYCIGLRIEKVLYRT